MVLLVGGASAADVVAIAGIVDGIELIDEAIAIGGRDSVGADGQCVAIDMAFAFCGGPVVVPEVTHVVVACFAIFIGFTRANLATSIVTITSRGRCALDGFRLAVGHVRDGVATGDETSNEAQGSEVVVSHE